MTFHNAIGEAEGQGNTPKRDPSLPEDPDPLCGNCGARSTFSEIETEQQTWLVCDNCKSPTDAEELMRWQHPQAGEQPAAA
jgi:hypothetical protein